MCAGSGIGKSQVCRVITHHLLKTTEKRIGYIALEESVERTALSLIGLEMGKCLHLDPFERDDEFRAAFDATVGNGRFYVYDHFGSLASDSLLNRIRFMIKTYDVDFVVLDHISIVVSGIGDGDERRLIDNTMTALRSLVEETKIAMILVSHLKRPEGRGHEEGRAVSLADLRGSQAIAQLSDMVIALERSQQAEEPEDRNKTTVRILKNRFSGETGVACTLSYDRDTGRLNETHQLDTTNPF
jgi:twinkle protein